MPGKIARLIFVLLLFAPAVSADPIIVSGSVTLVPASGPSGVRTEPYVLTGINFSANILASVGVFGLGSCSPIPGFNPPCTTVNPSWLSVGTDNFGSFTLNGVTYSSDVLNQISFFFNAAPVVIPLELQNAPGVVVTTAFTFSGGIATLDGMLADLTGQGTVTIFLIQRDAGLFSGLFLDRAIYTFGPVVQQTSVQAIPEPTTLLLFISSVVGAGIVRSRRAQKETS